MNISEVRQKFPQYQDLSDQQLADALYKKYYSDMPRDKFMGSLGIGADKSATSFWDALKANARLEPFNEGLVMGIARGSKDVVDTGAEYASKIGGEAEAERVRQMNEAGKANFNKDYGDSIGAGVGRIIGNTVAVGPAVKATGAVISTVPKLAGLGKAVASFGTQGGGIGTKVLGGGISGGISSGLIEPDAAVPGAAIGAAIPVVGKVASETGKTVAKIVKPLTAKGRDEIVLQLIRGSANDPAAVASRLVNPIQSVAPLTFNEVANDPGISSLTRSLVNKSKDFADDLAAMESRQNTARFNALYGMSGGEAGIAALKAARKDVTDPLLQAALDNASDVGTMGVRGAARKISGSPAYQRKAVKGAVREAVEPFAVKMEGGAKGWARTLSFEQAWGARQNIDDILNGASSKVNEKAAQAASAQLGMLRERLSTALNKASPDFAKYSRLYANESKKVDAAATLYDFVKAASTGSRDMNSNPILSGAMLDRALKNLEPRKWAALTQAQRNQVAQLVDELTTAARVKTLGKAVGSNTAQNLNQPDSLPFALRLMSGIAPSGTGLLSSGLDFLMRGAQGKVQGSLGQALLDPSVAARAFTPPAPAITPLYRQLIGQGASRALPVVPAGLLASQN